MQSRLKKTALAASLVALSSPILVDAQANLGSWNILPVQHMVTCIHSFLVPGPGVPGTNPKLVCVERPHNGGAGKYPPNKYTERANSAEVTLNAAQGTPMSSYARKSNSVTNPFCGGHAQMADGNIFMAGGDKEFFNDPVTGAAMLTDGTTARRVYTPYDSAPKNNDPWTTVSSDMKGRWYPTVVTLHDESQFIISGTSRALDLLEWAAKNFTINPTYEFYKNGQSTTPVDVQMLKDQDPWNLYPFVAQLPQSGNLWIFSGGPSITLNPTTQAVTKLPSMVDDKHHPRIYPFTPTVVMLPLTQANKYQATMMLCGGTLRDYGGKTTNITSAGPGSHFCSRVDPEAQDNKWNENHVQFAGSEVDATNQGKVMPDVVLMPDGKVLWVNGATWGTAGGDAGVMTNAHNPSYTTQIFDPITSHFTKGPDFKVARLYHSGALLLPDGRVITTGNEEANWADLDSGKPSKAELNQCFPFNGPLNNRTYLNNTASANCGDPFEYRIEAYTPGYLSLPGKPVIKDGHGTSYPAVLTYASKFKVELDTNAADVANVSFIRYGTTTHSTNTDQRFVELKILAAKDKTLYLEAPSNGFVAPPGNWMLFPVAKTGAVGHSVTIRMANGNPVTIDVPASSTLVRANVMALIVLVAIGLLM